MIFFVTVSNCILRKCVRSHSIKSVHAYAHTAEIISSAKWFIRGCDVASWNRERKMIAGRNVSLSITLHVTKWWCTCIIWIYLLIYRNLDHTLEFILLLCLYLVNDKIYYYPLFFATYTTTAVFIHFFSPFKFHIYFFVYFFTQFLIYFYIYFFNYFFHFFNYFFLLFYLHCFLVVLFTFAIFLFTFYI